MLAEMFDGPPAGQPVIGQRVVPGALAEAQHRYEAGRRAFIDAHPWFHPGLHRLVPG
jgi:hypothetical protein